MAATTDTLAALMWAATKLREIHIAEMFGDCVEDGQKFPCRTIQVLTVAAAHQTNEAHES